MRECNKRNNPIKVKYLHIMPMNSMFNGSMISMINDNPLDFNKNEHLFILTNESNYKEYRHYDNVIYDPDVLKMNLNKLYEYSRSSQYIFMHSLPFSLREIISLKKEIANKIIWCIWGHDLYRKPSALKGKVSIYKKVRRLVYRFLFDNIYARKVKQFYAIGIGFKYDVLEIRKLYGENIQVVMAPYGFGYPKSDVDKAISEFKSKKKDHDYLKIMIGHSSFPFLKHEDILNRLLKYKEENIKIVIPLSYGDKEYGQHIEKISKQLFNEKVQIIKDFMKPTDYVKFLIDVDIAIFDYEHQSALGNIMLLLYLEKKVYLCKRGIIRWGMTAEGIKTYDASDIGKVPFEELSLKHQSDERAVIYSGYYLNEKNIIKIWKNTLKEL